MLGARAFYALHNAHGLICQTYQSGAHRMLLHRRAFGDPQKVAHRQNHLCRHMNTSAHMSPSVCARTGLGRKQDKRTEDMRACTDHMCMRAAQTQSLDANSIYHENERSQHPAGMTLDGELERKKRCVDVAHLQMSNVCRSA